MDRIRSPGVIKATGDLTEDSVEVLRNYFNSVTPEEMVPLCLRYICTPNTRSASCSLALDFLAGFLEKCLVQQLEIIEKTEESKDNKEFSAPTENRLVSQMNEQLSAVIKSGLPQAQMILKWATQLLGTLCSKYSNRGKRPVNGSLGDSITQWIFCESTRVLLHILQVTPDFKKSQQDDDFIVTLLLNACSAHIPHFDWAIAKYARQRPELISIKGLAWGLEKYLETSGPPNSKEMISMIGILTHICGCHSVKVQKAMNELLKWSEGKESLYESLNLTKAGVVPFLLHLAVSTPALLTALSKGALSRLTLEDLPLHAQYAKDWCHLAGGLQSLVAVGSHAVLANQIAGRQILELILSSVESSPSPINEVVRKHILEIVLKDIAEAHRLNRPSIALLNCLVKEHRWLLSMILSNKTIRMETAFIILEAISIDHQQIQIQSIAFLLLYGTTGMHLSIALELAHNDSGAMVQAISLALSPAGNIGHPNQVLDPKLLWKNLATIMGWTNEIKLSPLKLGQAARENLVLIAEGLTNTTDIDQASLILNVIRKAVEDYPSSKPISVVQTSATVLAIVSYFYLCLNHLSGIQLILKMRDICGVVRMLCVRYNFARAILVRELLESSLFRLESSLFDGISKAPSGDSRLYDNFSLLEANYNQGSRVGRWQSTALRPVTRAVKRPHPGPPADLRQNTRMLLTVLRAACCGPDGQPSLDAIVPVALLLVELISPDVMYNGLPWPDEDFCKVTVERDLAIRRMLDESPLVWSLLSFIAFHRPALCYCSVILRAVVATLIGQWSTAIQQGRKAGQCEHLMDVTSRILQLMTLGQLLMPPLNAISVVIKYLDPVQVVDVLKECVWAYMRDNVPSPALFAPDKQGALWRDPATSKPDQKYIEPLRKSILLNIVALPTLYKSLFIPDAHEED